MLCDWWKEGVALCDLREEKIGMRIGKGRIIFFVLGFDLGEEEAGSRRSVSGYDLVEEEAGSRRGVVVSIWD